MIDPARYPSLRFEHPAPGVLEIVLDHPPVNALDQAAHRDLTYVWQEVDRDDDTRVVLLRAEGRTFSAGGDFSLVEAVASDPVVGARVMKEAGDLVRNLIDCSKPIVSAINGAAVGAGLAAALLADISIAGRSARILDGHVPLGVAAGDHAVVIWPLLVGMAKAKYYLLTNEPLTGEEAERIGLVSRVVDDDQLHHVALGIAQGLATGSQTAVAWTKRTLNHWLRAAYPAFEASLALEFLGFRGPDVHQGIAAAREKRPASFT